MIGCWLDVGRVRPCVPFFVDFLFSADCTRGICANEKEKRIWVRAFIRTVKINKSRGRRRRTQRPRRICARIGRALIRSFLRSYRKGRLFSFYQRTININV
jgi:hypothetical protein